MAGAASKAADVVGSILAEMADPYRDQDEQHGQGPNCSNTESQRLDPGNARKNPNNENSSTGNNRAAAKDAPRNAGESASSRSTPRGQNKDGDVHKKSGSSGKSRSHEREPAHSRTKSRDETDRESSRSRTKSRDETTSPSNPEQDGGAHNKRSAVNKNKERRSDSNKDSGSNVRKELKEMREQLALMKDMIGTFTPIMQAVQAQGFQPGGSAGAPLDRGDNMHDSDDEDLVSPANANDSESEDDVEQEPSHKKRKLQIEGDDDEANQGGLDCLRDLTAQVSQTEVRGPDIDSNVAKLVDTILTTGMPKKLLNEKANKFPFPANCNRMTQVKVNPKLWDNLRPAIKTGDKMMQGWQCNILHGMTAFLQLADSCIKNINGEAELPSPSDMLAKLTTGVSVISGVVHDMSLSRRDRIKPDLHDNYKGLCSANNPVTSQLFGDNLEQNVKDIEDTLKITKKTFSKGKAPVGYQKPYAKTTSYGHFASGSHKTKPPFLGWSNQQGRNHKFNQNKGFKRNNKKFHN